MPLAHLLPQAIALVGTIHFPAAVMDSTDVAGAPPAQEQPDSVPRGCGAGRLGSASELAQSTAALIVIT